MPASGDGSVATVKQLSIAPLLLGRNTKAVPQLAQDAMGTGGPGGSDCDLSIL